MAKGNWGSARAIAIRNEIGYLPEARRAALVLDLIGCLAAEAALLVGREHVALEFYGLADEIAGDLRLPRRGATRP